MTMRKKKFLANVAALARLQGWLIFHPHDSRGSSPGFPDLCMVRERVVFAKLKVGQSQPTANQLIWITSLQAAGTEAYVWRPHDWPAIESILVRLHQDMESHP